MTTFFQISKRIVGSFYCDWLEPYGNYNDSRSGEMRLIKFAVGNSNEFLTIEIALFGFGLDLGWSWQYHDKRKIK